MEEKATFATTEYRHRSLIYRIDVLAFVFGMFVKFLANLYCLTAVLLKGSVELC